MNQGETWVARKSGKRVRRFATTEAFWNVWWFRAWSRAWVGSLLLITVSCAGQFELDLPDEHPALVNVKNAPIEPAPNPYDQRYPMALEEEVVVAEPAKASEPHMDGDPSSKTRP